MSAVPNLLPFDTGEETAPPLSSEEYEALTAALNECTRTHAALLVAANQVSARREQLISGATAARRRRARTTLDNHFPPLTFFGIEQVEPNDEERGSFADEARELDEEIRRLQKTLGRTDALINLWVRDRWDTTCPWFDLSLEYKRALLGYLRGKAKNLITHKGAI